MSPMTILLFVLSQTVSIECFTCIDKSELCSFELCNEHETAKDCLKTCQVCTDEGCSEGYYHGDGDSCLSCSVTDTKHSPSYKEKCNIFCSSNKTHGQDCNKTCSDRCLDKICYRWTGDCERCPSGFSGPRCQQHCNNTDEKGDCIGVCCSGFFGPKCDKGCPDGCKDKVCNRKTGECSECPEGSWGQTCQFHCFNNCLKNSCNRTGQCSLGCKDVFFGMDCSKKCSANCLHQECNRENGSCTDGCVSGEYYGDTCDKICPQRCLNSTCDRTTGKCKNGCSDSDIYGAFCNYSCGSYCRSVRCENISDYVECRAVCVSGRKGEHCSDFCPRNCKETCHQLSGRCLHGCLSGYHGVYCNKSCPANCLGSACHQNNRTCIHGCVKSFYGPTCSNRCSDNCAVCNANGICISPSNSRHNELKFYFDGWTVMYGVIIFSILLSTSLAVWFILRKMKKRSKKKQQRARRRKKNLARPRDNQIQKYMEIQPVIRRSKSDNSSDPPDVVRCHGNPPPASAADDDILMELFQLQTATYDEKDDNDDDSEDDVYVYDSLQKDIRSSSKVFQNDAEEYEIENETLYEKPHYRHLGSNLVNNTGDIVPLLESEQDESVDIKHFHIYVYNMSLMKGFHREFQFLQKRSWYSTDVADKLENIPKNRYRNIKPYDYNRVTLESIHRIPDSDYINASFIDGYHKSKWYIAAQGPTEKTAADFWRMVWEVNSTHMIMLTDLVENNQPKCSLYWPELETKSKKYEDLMIKLKQAEFHPTYTSRIFKLTKTSNPELTRTVTQLHYMDWMDKQVPNNTRALLDFILYVRGLRDRGDDHPLIVHCSAGVGRTGTFIAIDYLLDQALSRGRLDVVGCVARLRKQRNHMVQTFRQYNFIHQLLLEWLLSFNNISERDDVTETDSNQEGNN